MIPPSWMVKGAVALAVGTAVATYVMTDSDVVANVCYLGVMVGASIGAWIGAERAPHGERLVPRLIAVGVSLTALGDVLWTVLDAMAIGTDVSIADPPWFASYAALCAALWVLMARSGQDSRVAVDFVIDALTIVVVSVLVFWSMSVAAIAADDSVSPLVRTVWAAYPIADAVLLALVVRVLTSRAARGAMSSSFAAGVLLWLAADVLYLQAPDSDLAMVMMDVAWMVAPVLLAAAAWRARVAAGVPVPSSTPGGSVPQLVIAVGPLFVPPALEVVADLRGQEDRPLLLLLGSTVLIALAFVRTARLIRSEERAHTELEVARDAALDASRAKSMFLANMSHEIRTPLTTVLATAELLEDTAPTGLQLRLLERMQRSGAVLRSLVEEVLDFSRIEAGQVELAEVEFDLPALVDEIADVYAARASACVRFDRQLDAGTPRWVVGDQARLAQVVGNLLDNALKFTHERHVRLLVRPAAAHAGVVELVVDDTGIGIAEEDLSSVFESFHQVDGSATRHYEGSGLGLAICRDLTELMGGTVTVHSAIGVGSTFVVRVPLPPVTGPSGSPADDPPLREQRPDLRVTVTR